jgi:hypothetical protein
MAISIQDSLKPIQAGMTLPLVRDPRPAQYALGGSALEWQGYKATCIRVQQGAAMRQDAALMQNAAKRGPMPKHWTHRWTSWEA